MDCRVHRNESFVSYAHGHENWNSSYSGQSTGLWHPDSEVKEVTSSVQLGNVQSILECRKKRCRVLQSCRLLEARQGVNKMEMVGQGWPMCDC